MSTRNQAAWCIGSNTTPPLEWGDERRGACPDCGRWVGMIGPSGAVPRMSKHLPSPRSEEVKQLRAERDRYRDALAKSNPTAILMDGFTRVWSCCGESSKVLALTLSADYPHADDCVWLEAQGDTAGEVARTVSTKDLKRGCPVMRYDDGIPFRCDMGIDICSRHGQFETTEVICGDPT